jgi:hypothetical protein
MFLFSVRNLEVSMRHRVSKGGRGVVLLLFVLAVAGSAVLLAALGGASSAWAADEDKPELLQAPAKTPVGKAPLEQPKAPGNVPKDNRAGAKAAEPERPAAAPAPEKPAPGAAPGPAPGAAAAPAPAPGAAAAPAPAPGAAPDKPAIERPVGEKPAGVKKAEDEPPPPDESALVWLYHSMGPRYVIIFLAVSFNEMALVVMIVLGLRRSCICPLELAAEFDGHLKKKQYQEAYDVAKKNDSFLGRVLASGMANLSEGYDAAVEAMEETGEEQTMRLEQRNGNIALIAQIGPMLGLLATVDGIVKALGRHVKDVTVIMRADQDVPAGKVQEVLHICQQMGFERFLLRARVGSR